MEACTVYSVDTNYSKPPFTEWEKRQQKNNKWKRETMDEAKSEKQTNKQTHKEIEIA